MAGHAVLSPSGAHRWLRCAAAPAMELKLPRSTSSYADEGTAAHFVASSCLSHGTNASIFAGMGIHVSPSGDCMAVSEGGLLPDTGGVVIRVNDDMVRYVQQYIDFVQEQSKDGIMLVEEELPIGHLTGEQDATGTGDAIVIRPFHHLKVIDLKYGYQEVDAEGNEQLKMYALGAIEKYAAYGDFEFVEMYIFQPRVRSEPSLSVISITDLVAWGEDIKNAARLATAMLEGLGPLSYNPGEKTCQWCRAKATCPALAKYIEETVGANFEDISKAAPSSLLIEDMVLGCVPADDGIGDKLRAVDMIESWCKAIRAEVERRLFAGVAVPGFKLVQGKKGNRQWRNEESVEELFTSMRLKLEEKYNFKLISPTQAEKLLKDASPRRWVKVLPLITQAPGQASVAPESDKRPAFDPAAKADDFEHVADVGDLV